MMIALDVRSLHKSYGSVHALRGIDLSVEAGGQILGLLGPNGAGKTTLVEILEGLRTPSSGSVRVLGLDPRGAPAALRARLGVQLQTTAFIPELTVAETLRLYASFYPRCPRSLAIGDVLPRVDLTDKAKALVGTLSGGQKQRLALAMAMLHDPDLYILDEPTSGLDPIARRQIHDILPGAQARGKTILLSSHYLDEIEALADRVIILSAGTIVADGTPLELLARGAGASTLWLAVTGCADADAARAGRDLRGAGRRAVPLPHRRSHRGDRRSRRVASRLGRAARRPAPEAAVARRRLPAARRLRYSPTRWPSRSRGVTCFCAASWRSSAPS